MNNVERQLSLLLYLLNTSQGRSRQQIFLAMPQAYPSDNPESSRRQFERDKDSLKAMGFPLSLVKVDGDTLYAVEQASTFLDTGEFDFEQEEKLRSMLMSIGKNDNHIYSERIIALRIYRKLFGSEDLDDEIDAALLTEVMEPFKSGDHKSLVYSRLAAAIEKRESVTLVYLPLTHSQMAVEAGIEDPAWFQQPDLNDSVRQAAAEKGFSLTTRQLDPHGLLLNRSRWCLVARQMQPEEGMRTLYLDRIYSLVETGQSFQPEPGFSIKNYSLHPLLRSVHPARVCRFTLPGKVNCPDALRLGRYFRHIEHQVTPVKGQQRFKVVVEVTNIDALFQFLLKHGITGCEFESDDQRVLYMQYLDSAKSNTESWFHV